RTRQETEQLVASLVSECNRAKVDAQGSQKELSALEHQYERDRKTLSDQIDQLRLEAAELEKQHTTRRQQFDESVQELQQACSRAQVDYQAAMDLLAQAESQSAAERQQWLAQRAQLEHNFAKDSQQLKTELNRIREEATALRGERESLISHVVAVEKN